MFVETSSGQEGFLWKFSQFRDLGVLVCRVSFFGFCFLQFPSYLSVTALSRVRAAISFVTSRMPR